MSEASIQGVPYLDLSQEFSALRDEWFALADVSGSKGQWILGPNVSAFEEEAAAYVGTRHAVSVANGTDALVLSLRVLGVGPGDEVITTPYTFFATAESISLVGATPVFADIDAVSFNLDPVSVESRITSKTRAIMPVHLFGHPADMTSLNALAETHKLAVVEDAAQAFGARHDGACVGSHGATGCFSFYPTKVLGCYGDGGLITTNDDALAEHIRRLRNHGASAPFMHVEFGCNSRLDEIQAALLRIKLRVIDEAISARNRIADRYDAQLADRDVITPARPGNGLHAFNLYTIRMQGRDAARARLNEQKIGSSLCYPLGLHLQEVYESLAYKPGDLPVTEACSLVSLSLPIFPDMTEAQVDRVCEVLLAATG